MDLDAHPDHRGGLPEGMHALEFAPNRRSPLRSLPPTAGDLISAGDLIETK